MTVPFVKMHGLGNDFVVFEASEIPGWQEPHHLAKLAQWVCDRHTGVGGDGILVVAPPPSPEFAAQFIYYNNDGTVAEMCGNGIRCFARYLVDRGLVKDYTFTLSTLAGPITPTVLPDGQVTVDMGAPRFASQQVPFLAPLPYSAGYEPALLDVDGHKLKVWPVSMGNPHAILFQSLHTQPLDPLKLGPLLEVHPAFPARTNVEFVEQLDANTLSVKVWERGCGWTLACGTGACGVTASAVRAKLVQADVPVTVRLPGGDLSLSWDGVDGHSVTMTGPATTVFSGNLSRQLMAQLLQWPELAEVAHV